MPALAALITLTAAAQAPTPAPLFAAFQAVCQHVGQSDGFEQLARAGGWAEVTEGQADRRIAAIVAKARDAAKREAPGAATHGLLFRQKIDGRDVWLAVSRVTFTRDGEKRSSSGCRVYDLDAPALIPTRTLSAWVGTPPTSVIGSGNAVKALWRPWQPGVTLEITYVPRDNPLGAQYGIQGLVLVSQAIGGF